MLPGAARLGRGGRRCMALPLWGDGFAPGAEVHQPGLTGLQDQQVLRDFNGMKFKAIAALY